MHTYAHTCTRTWFAIPQGTAAERVAETKGMRAACTKTTRWEAWSMGVRVHVSKRESVCERERVRCVVQTSGQNQTDVW